MIIGDRKNTITAIEVSSPQELRTKLQSQIQLPRDSWVSLILRDPGALVFPFNLENVPEKQIADVLMMDATDMLSAPTSETVIDFTVLYRKDGNIGGVYACLPKSILQEYAGICRQAGLILVEVFPWLTYMTCFLKQKYGLEGGRTALIECTDSRLNMIVYSDNRYELIRSLEAEDETEAFAEIIQTLRCSCSMSPFKAFDKIYLFGDLPNKKEMRETAVRIFHSQVWLEDKIKSEDGHKLDSAGGDLNLYREQGLPSTERRRLSLVIDGVLAACFMVVVFLGIICLKQGKVIQSLSASYSAEELQYAKAMKARLE